ncbi:MAG TPA: NAD(P)/FAD-dependent oxidoreductase [Caldimonas sp.]|jgi:NADH dehydrogenase
MHDERNIVIVGGGFAGTTLARGLERLPLDGHRIVLVSEESYTTFHPMLAEVVGAAVFPEHVVAPIRQMLPQSRFVMGRVTGIDWQRRALTATTLAGRQEIDFAHIAIAVGARANLDLVPGLAEHALPLKLVGDAMFIRNRVLQRVARIELECDPVVRRRLGHFVVIGGGFSGVEVAGQLADFLRGIRRYYRRVGADELRVTLLEGADRLLLEMPPSLARAALASLTARGVEVRLGARAARVDADGVRLVDGAVLAGATVVCTIGTRPNPLLEQLGVALEGGRTVTAGDLSIPGREGAWAIGDCALIGNGVAANDPAGAPARDALAPPTAQFAVAEAKALARNIAARIAGRPTHAFRHVSRGSMATTGHLKGVAELLGVRLTGLPAWLLWRAYYLLQMPTFGRKVRIWVEWTWAMFFDADITHLRFTRTHEADAGPSNDGRQPTAATPTIVR